MDHALVHSGQHKGGADFRGSGFSKEWEIPDLRAEPQIRRN